MFSDDNQVMMSIKDIAQRFGISSAAVSKAVAKLVASHDIPVERDTRGRVSKVSLAHYERHRANDLNPAKTKPSPRPAIKDENSFDEAKRQNEWLKVDRLKLDRQEMLGRTVRKDKIVEGLAHCAREIQARVGRIANKADDGALAVSKEGAHGLRVMLRDVAAQLNSDIADILSLIADAAPETDPILEDTDQ